MATLTLLLQFTRPVLVEVRHPPRAVDGVLDLSDWDFHRDGSVPLSGQWGFHWDALLEPAALPATPPAFLTLPGSWAEPGRAEGRGPAGEATFALTVLLPDKPPPLAVLLPDLRGAARLLSGAATVLEHGRPGVDAQSERAGGAMAIGPVLESTSGPLRLVLQVSNHFHVHGGVHAPPILGATSLLMPLYIRANAVALMAAAGCFVLFSFHLFNYLVRTAERGHLLLAVIAFFLTLFHLAWFDIPRVLGFDIDRAITLRLIYVAITGSCCSLLLFKHYLFPQELPRLPALVLSAAALAIALFVLVTPVYLGSQARDPTKLLSLAVAALATWTSILAFFRQRPGSLLTCAAMVLSVPFVASDILLGRDLSQAGYLSGIALLILALAHAAVLGERVSVAFAAAEALSGRLGVQKRDLEAVVAERTRALQDANARLEQINEQKARFISIIAHDLRSPFNALYGFSRMIAEDGNDMPKERLLEYCGYVNQSAESIHQLLESLLQWSRVQMNHASCVAAEVDLGILIRRTLALLGPVAYEKNIRMVSTVGTLPAWVDSTMMETVLRNLVTNAIKFTRPGGLIAIGGREIAANRVELTVTDTGVGMDADTVARLFKVDQRVSIPGTEGESGTGMGLLLTQALIERQSGSIRVESRPGEGSTFIVVMPRGPTALAQPEPAEDERRWAA